jgi:iron complex transport system substrate-binding protein
MTTRTDAVGNSRPHRRARWLVALVALAALGVTACGDSGSSSGATTTPTPGAASGAKRIVSLSPTATEMLFAIGAGKQVVAVDDQSNYPPEAPRTDLSGFTPNVEASAGTNTDRVVVANDVPGLASGLKSLGIELLIQPPAPTLDAAYAQLTELGRRTGHQSGAADVIASMKKRVDVAAAKANKTTPPLRYYHEVDDTLYTATSKTFIGALYTMAGLTNVADAADKDGSGYPQLSAEYLVARNPDVIFLADSICCKVDKASVAARPGWSTIAAVKSGSIVTLDDDIASRWGPRSPELLEAIVAATASLKPATK